VIFDPHAVKIFTDGSCYKNPGGLSGCAAVVEYPDDWERQIEQIVDCGVAESSINRMELLAWNRAIEWVIGETSSLRGTRVQLITDSQYVHQNAARAASWRNNGWRNYDDRPIDNRDLWKRFLSLRSRLRANVTFHQTKGKKSPALRGVNRISQTRASAGSLNLPFHNRTCAPMTLDGDNRTMCSQTIAPHTYSWTWEPPVVGCLTEQSSCSPTCAQVRSGCQKWRSTKLGKKILREIL
jgi:ribonuclease HI